MKKIAGAAVTTLLIATMLTGSVGIASGAGAAGRPAPQGETTEVQKTLPSARPAADAAQPAAEPAANDYAAYLFVHFAGDESSPDHEQVYFSVSQDGEAWKTLNGGKPVLSSDKGEQGVRDPHIIRLEENGGFAIVATDLSINKRPGDKWGTAQTGGSENIIVWKSNGNTLTDWSDSAAINVGGSYRALDVWAPESVWDKEEQKYMVFWASIVGDRATASTDWIYRIYRSYTTDFVNFTEPEVYMERQDSVIDTTFYYDEESDMYYRFTKSEGGNRNWVFMEQGKSINGEFEMVSSFKVDGKHYSQMGGYEGPTLYKLNNSDTICLLLDHYGAGAGYAPYTTEDISKGEFTSAGSFNFNGVTFRHGSVIPITQAEYDSLLEAYPFDATIPTPSDPDDPDKKSGSKIFDLKFDDESLTATVGDFVTEIMGGEATYVAGKNSNKKALELKDNKYLKLSGDIFKGKDNLTISFDVKITGGGTSWLLYAASNDQAQIGNDRLYYGLLFKDGKTFSAERYNHQDWSRDNDAYDDTQAQDKWVNVTIVYYKLCTKIYIDGQPATGKPMATAVGKLSSIIGENPTVYVGKANWGNGEYCSMELDRIQIFDYAMSDSNVALLPVAP